MKEFIIGEGQSETHAEKSFFIDKIWIFNNYSRKSSRTLTHSQRGRILQLKITGGKTEEKWDIYYFEKHKLVI